MALATFKDLCLDAVDPVRLGTFWGAALGLEVHRAGDDSDGDVVLRGATPAHTVWVNRVPEPRTGKNRVHLDLNVASVEQLTALGARVLDADSFTWTVMADPEGGEFCAFVRADPITSAIYEIGVDSGDSAADCHRIATWWAAVLGARVVDDERGYSWVEGIEGAPFGSIDFAPVPEPRTAKNRVHLDLTTADLDGLVGHGARVLRARDHEIGWTVLADPDGNEFCAFEA